MATHATYHVYQSRKKQQYKLHITAYASWSQSPNNIIAVMYMYCVCYSSRLDLSSI